ncbi:hypothetical protein AGMMS50229_16880 [Campylobacterota bacterium]|nr:hypothetical protein AGMMS50229_16880 [Campylobacterota bacterium]
MERNYKNNLKALYDSNRELWQRLQSVDGNERFEVFAGKDAIDVNILDHNRKLALYDEPISDIEIRVGELGKYLNYAFLAFFGVGNGFLIRTLLKNRALKHLMIVEPEIEMIYIALHLNDFSADIRSARLMLIYADDFDMDIAMRICKIDAIVVFLKLYDLELTCNFYSAYQETIERVNKTMVDSIIQTVLSHGNDLQDSLDGIDNFLENSSEMIENIPFIEFRDNKNSEAAVVIATGPSLTKQLPLLKEISEFVTIIAVDASLPILEKWDIVPDVVTTLERVELSALFYTKTSSEFHKKVGCFALSALAHPKTIEAISGNKSLIMRPFGYMKVFELNRFGYAGIGMSAANLAFEIAFLMGYTKTILIGQDLAYAGDKEATHAEGHIFGTTDEYIKASDPETVILPAWGEKGTVKSTPTWVLFRNFYIQNINDAKHRMITYNCTEGGCHIDGAIDEPFSVVAARIVDRTKAKQRFKFKPKDTELLKKEKAQIASVTGLMIERADRAIKELKALYEKVNQFALPLENIAENERLKLVKENDLLRLSREIDEFKAHLRDPVFSKYFWDSLRALVINQELNIAKIIVQIPTSQEEKNRISLEFIMAHRFWLFSVLIALEAERDILRKHI